jgi:hypothetical protein
MKKIFLNLSKTGKIITGSFTLFVAIAGTIAIIKTWRTKDIRGEWRLTFYNDECAYIPYINERHEQKVFFSQNESVISGDGEKWSYNGRELPAEEHRILKYEGTIHGSKLEAKYILHGLKRISNGTVSLIISSDGLTLEGSYSGTAGSCKGRVTGRKVN